MLLLVVLLLVLTTKHVRGGRDRFRSVHDGAGVWVGIHLHLHVHGGGGKAIERLGHDVGGHIVRVGVGVRVSVSLNLMMVLVVNGHTHHRSDAERVERYIERRDHIRVPTLLLLLVLVSSIPIRRRILGRFRGRRM